MTDLLLAQRSAPHVLLSQRSAPHVLYCIVCVAGQCAVDPADREECGYPGIGQERCLARPGCCFDDSIRGVKWCFKEKTTEPKPEPEPEPSKKGMEPSKFLNSFFLNGGSVSC